MELFLFGLIVGIAVGMWGAILLYRLSGKAEPGWPFRRKQQDKVSSSKVNHASGPADDFTEEYYAQQESRTEQSYTSYSGARPSSEPTASPVPPPAKTSASSKGDATASDPSATNVNTDADKHDSAQTSVESAAVAPNPELTEDAEMGTPADAYTTLLARMKGDVQATEALIEAERQRTPAVPRPRLIENALLRLQYSQQ